MDNKNNKNDIYNSVFNNIVLKRNILNHYISINERIHFNSIDEWIQFQFKEYINSVSLGFKCDLNKLPTNINSVKIVIDDISNYNNSSNNNNIIVPEFIKSLNLKLNISELSFNSILDSAYLNSSSLFSNSIYSSKITTLSLSCCGTPIPEIKPNTLPQSITDLSIHGIYNYKLKRGVLPSSNLIKLTMYGVLSIEDHSFPSSLKDVTLSSSNPLIINQLSSNLVKLKFSTNDTSSEISRIIKFPNSLEVLEINRCGSFNANLPNNLKSVSITMNSLNGIIRLPSKLEHLSVSFRENNINRELLDHQNIPKNLKSLSISCTSLLDQYNKPYLPDKLESLKILEVGHHSSFNQVLRAHQLPSSLTHLDLGSSFNQNIHQNVLPSNLKTLVLGYSYSQPIDPIAIPASLQLLDIQKCLNYTHPIELSSTHPYTLVNSNNINIYYQPNYNNNNDNNNNNSKSTQIHALKIPNEFNQPLSTLQLQDKSNLVYLHLGNFNQSIQLSDLPTQNNIKTLELGERFNQTIDLQLFKNLETIIINSGSNHNYPKIITSTQDNYFSLKNINVHSKKDFIKHLDINYYHFLNKLIK